MKKFICIIMCIIMCVTDLSGACFASAENTLSAEYYSEDITADFESETVGEAVAAGASPAISGKAAVLMEKQTGKVLFEQNAHERLAPASITKVMSLLLISEAIDCGKLSLDTKITASAHACSMGGSQIWLKENEVMTVDELLRAAVIASANDATVALAEAVAGSEEAFVDMMNAKAAELGMEDTHFVNSSGLDAEGHLTSAYDIAVMSVELIKHDFIKNYTTVWMDSLRDGASQLVNTNKLIRFYQGATGLKTGTTSSAGFCVSATAEKNGMELCAVILGAENNDGRFSSAKALLNYGFANWEIERVELESKKLKAVNVEKGIEEKVPIEAEGVGEYLLEKGNKSEISVKYDIPETVTAPIAKGEKIGKATVTVSGKKIGEINITASSHVKKLTFTAALIKILNALFTL